MKAITWNTITVGQFQDILKLSSDSGIDELEKLSKLVCIAYNKTETEVDNMAIAKFNRYVRSCRFLLEDEVQGAPVDSFWVGIRKYKINFDPAKLRHRQYVEVSTFAKKPIENMHEIMAAIVERVRFGFRQRNEVKAFKDTANTMLNAPLLPVYHACVFFCKNYNGLIPDIRQYSCRIRAMMNPPLPQAL